MSDTTTFAAGAPPEVRARLALALDVDDIVQAQRLAGELRPWFGVAKVGLELYSAAGPDAVGAMLDLGYDVFVDLKLHDIPNTVGRAARVVGALGARYLTMHAHGGLVSETSALTYALSAYQWWLDRDIYPIYFIWETSAFEIIKQRLGLSRGLGDWWDRRFEQFARPVGKPLWGAMKEAALLSSSLDAGGGDAGGAWKFAKALAPLVKNPPPGKRISLHTVGHSAGAIFHAHYIPALVERVLESVPAAPPAHFADLFECDREARLRAEAELNAVAAAPGAGRR